MKESKSNVLVIFCDQLRLDLLGCYGGRQVRTPNIDALAADSMVFDRAYTPTAICSPARASLMSGLYPHAHHMFNNSTPRYSFCHHARPDLCMIQDWADDHTRYQTGYFGKWHIGTNEDLFASRFHVTHPRPNSDGLCSFGHPRASLGELVQEQGRRDLGPGSLSGTLRMPMRDFPDVAAARYCRQFIESRDPNRPFLAFCAFPGPHSPWLVPEEFGIRYDPDRIALWPNRDDSLDGKPLNQQKLQYLTTTRLENVSVAERDRNLRQKLAACFSYLELVDQCLGEVIADLKRLGLYDKTAVFFTADHGDMSDAHGFPSKGSYMYDEIYRIPLLYKPAGARRHARFEQPVHLMDVTATCVDLMAGGEQAGMNGQPLHGGSLNRFAAATPDWPRTVHYAQYHGDWYGHYSARMVTDGRWKMVWNFSDLCELYDLENDPGELRNRYYDPVCRGIRDAYFARLSEAAEQVNDGQAVFWLRHGSSLGIMEDAVHARFG